VREVFSCIKLQYRKTQQNIEAIKRQMDANPDAFKSKQDEHNRMGTAASAMTSKSAA